MAGMYARYRLPAQLFRYRGKPSLSVDRATLFPSRLCRGEEWIGSAVWRRRGSWG